MRCIWVRCLIDSGYMTLGCDVSKAKRNNKKRKNAVKNAEYSEAEIVT